MKALRAKMIEQRNRESAKQFDGGRKRIKCVLSNPFYFLWFYFLFIKSFYKNIVAVKISREIEEIAPN